MRTIAVVTAGLSQPSSTRLLADKLASATRLLNPDVAIEVIELRDLAIDITKNMLTGFPSPTLRSAIDTVTAADGLIAVTPVFTASYSGLFKSFFDVLDQKVLEGKPVLIGATGGTERHSLVLDFALRPLFAYLRAAPVATAVYAASSDWASPGELDTRVRRAAGELAARLSDAPVVPGAPAGPEASGPPAATVAAGTSGFVPFEQLLAGEK